MKKTVILFSAIFTLIIGIAVTAGGCGSQLDQGPAPEVAVTVTDKTNIPENYDSGQYSDRVEFTFDVENLTDKDIKGVQGTLQVLDLFDTEILSIGTDFTGETIPANSSVTIKDLGLDINQFMDTHLKLYNEAYEDLKFQYSVTHVVFADAKTDENAPPEPAVTGQKAEVVVTGKTNMPEDYDAGRYSPWIELTFDVFNRTGQDIKGIQGVLTVKDMFGTDILSSQCDFTGKNIPASGSAAFDELGFEVNEFMDEHVKFFNEKFEDLIFEYQMTSIVYADGTAETF